MDGRTAQRTGRGTGAGVTILDSTLRDGSQAAGISKRVLDEAKKALNVQSVKEGSQWYWQLPEKTG